VVEMTNFEGFLDILKGKIKEFAENNWKEHLEAVISDGSEFL